MTIEDAMRIAVVNAAVMTIYNTDAKTLNVAEVQWSSLRAKDQEIITECAAEKGMVVLVQS